MRRHGYPGAALGFHLPIPPPPVPTITTTTVPTGQVSVPYVASLVASGGTAPYTWTVVAGTLPAGVTLTAATLSGTPTVAGSSSFTVQVTDALAQTDVQALSLTVGPGAPPPQPSITTVNLPPALVGQSYTATVQASGGTLPYAWLVIAGTLPTGLTLQQGAGIVQNMGVISGTPTAASSNAVSFQVTDGRNQTAAKQFTITVTNPPPTPLPQTIPYGSAPSTTNLGTETLQPGAQSPPYPINWDTQGEFVTTPFNIPAGLTQFTIRYAAAVAASRKISIDGNVIFPNLVFPATGNFQTWSTVGFTQTMTSGQHTMTMLFDVPSGSTNFINPDNLKLTVGTPPVVITTPSLPTGTTGVAYSKTLAAAGGTQPYSWAVTVGSLPSGLVLNGATIQGTPSAAANSTFTIRATDVQGKTDTQVFNITVGAANTIFMVPANIGTTNADCWFTLKQFLNDKTLVPDGTLSIPNTIRFQPNRVYTCENILTIQSRNNLIFDGNGATIRATESHPFGLEATSTIATDSFTYNNHGLVSTIPVTIRRSNNNTTGIADGGPYWPVLVGTHTFGLSNTQNGPPIAIGGTSDNQIQVMNAPGPKQFTYTDLYPGNRNFDRRTFSFEQCRNIRVTNMTLLGAAPGPQGHYDARYASQTGILAHPYGPYEFDHLTIRNHYGDGIEVLNDVSTTTSNVVGAHIHHCIMSGACRQGFTVASGTDVLFENNDISLAGRHIVDIEGDQPDGGQDIQRVVFRANKVGVALIGFWVGQGNSKIETDITIGGLNQADGNILTGIALEVEDLAVVKTASPVTYFRRARMVIGWNVSDTAGGSTTPRPGHLMRLKGWDDVTVVNNRAPVDPAISGACGILLDNCSGYTGKVSGNTFTNTVLQFSEVNPYNPFVSAGGKAAIRAAIGQGQDTGHFWTSQQNRWNNNYTPAGTVNPFRWNNTYAHAELSNPAGTTDSAGFGYVGAPNCLVRVNGTNILGNATSGDANCLNNIIGGTYDGWFTNTGQWCKALSDAQGGTVVYTRPLFEGVDGDWFDWGIGHNGGNSVGQFNDAFNHACTKIRAGFTGAGGQVARLKFSLCGAGYGRANGGFGFSATDFSRWNQVMDGVPGHPGVASWITVSDVDTYSNGDLPTGASGVAAFLTNWQAWAAGRGLKIGHGEWGIGQLPQSQPNHNWSPKAWADLHTTFWAQLPAGMLAYICLFDGGQIDASVDWRGVSFVSGTFPGTSGTDGTNVANALKAGWQ